MGLPSSSKHVCKTIQQARIQLKDPDCYRWPPHVYLLYPFHDPYTTSAIDTTRVCDTDTTSPKSPDANERKMKKQQK
jgi:hypothetical protein